MSNINYTIFIESNRAEKVMLGGKTAAGTTVSDNTKRQIAEFAKKSNPTAEKFKTPKFKKSEAHHIPFLSQKSRISKPDHPANALISSPMRDKNNRILKRLESQETKRGWIGRKLNSIGKTVGGDFKVNFGAGLTIGKLGAKGGAALGALLGGPAGAAVGATAGGISGYIMPTAISATAQRTARKLLSNNHHIESKHNVVDKKDKESYLKLPNNIHKSIKKIQHHLNPTASNISNIKRSKETGSTLDILKSGHKTIDRQIDNIKHKLHQSSILRTIDKGTDSFLNGVDHLTGSHAAALAAGEENAKSWGKGLWQSTKNVFHHISRLPKSIGKDAVSLLLLRDKHKK